MIPFVSLTIIFAFVFCILILEGVPLMKALTICFSSFVFCSALFVFLNGCTASYKPNVNVEHADIQHQSGNSATLKGEYNAK